MTDDRYPGFWQATGLLVLVILLQILLGSAATLLPGGVGKAPHPLVIGGIALVAGLIAARLGWRRRGGPFELTFPLQPVSGTLMLAVTITIVGLSIVMSEAGNWLESVLPIPEGLARLFESLTSGEYGLWPSVFALSIAAPLAEEPLLRGVILHGLRARYSQRTAILTSAALFGVLHLNPWQFVSAVAFGVVAAWWVLRSRSLVPALYGHALGNGLPIVVSLFGFGIPGYTSGPAGGVTFQPWWFTVTGLVLLAIGLTLAHRDFVTSGSAYSLA